MFKKILICISLSILCLSVFSSTVYAEGEQTDSSSSEYDYEGEYDFEYSYTVEFTKDKKIVFKDEKGNIVDAPTINLSDVQPGDSLQAKFNLANTSGQTVDWYMYNNSSAFESSVAKDAAYEYELTYDHFENGPKIYSNNSVGGQIDNNIPEGITEATDSLKDYFLLHEGFATGGDGLVTYSLLIDGVSSEFVYQGSDAALNVRFAVVLPQEPENKHEEKVIVIPYTGDTINMNVYIIAEVLSLIFLAVVLYMYYRYLKTRKEA